MKPETKEAIDNILCTVFPNNYQRCIWYYSIEQLLKHPEILALEGYHRSEQINEPIGILDKSGKQICEGDIIVKDNGVWGVIVWKAPFYEVTVDVDQSSQYTREWISDSLVIGNIKTHELPTSDKIAFKSVCNNLYCPDMVINGEHSQCCGRSIKTIPEKLNLLPPSPLPKQ